MGGACGEWERLVGWGWVVEPQVCEELGARL